MPSDWHSAMRFIRELHIFCSKSHLFRSQWEWNSKGKQPIKLQGQQFKVTYTTSEKWKTKSHALCDEFCKYYYQTLLLQLLFFKQLTHLIIYSFWMTIMSSFRLKTYFRGSFQHSVSILTNMLAIFLQHRLKIHMTPSPTKHNQTKTTRTNSGPSQEGRCFQVSGSVKRSNRRAQICRSVNKHSQNAPRFTKQWMNAGANRAILKISWNKRHRKNLTRSWA